MPVQDLDFIATAGIEKEAENYLFRQYLQPFDGNEMDAIVLGLNAAIAPAIDCTECGNCCRELMINVENSDIDRLSLSLNISSENFASAYIEKSSGGEVQVMNMIPCHFLNCNKCTVYAARPEECRVFPGLDTVNFKSRLFATFMHYGRCPIIYNVIEALKLQTGFVVSEIKEAE